jgi:subtilisin family serine protease
MKKALFLFIILVLAACMQQEPLAEPAAPASREGDSSLVPGEAVVLVREEQADGFGLADLSGLSDALGIRSAERVFPDAGEFEPRHRAAGLHRWYRISYDRTVDVTKAEADLSAADGIEAVEIPRRKVRRSYFNDPFAFRQWHLVNTGTLGSNFVRGIDINVEPVWKEFTTGSREVIVAVVDGGVDRSHQDMGGVVLPPSANGGSRNFVAGYDPMDIPADDHGTHVAGVIGALNGNGTGISSVAGGRDGKGGVRIMSCTIFGEEEEGTLGDEDAEALVWAADHGAVIANNSWGYAFNSAVEAKRGAQQFIEQPSALKTAIDYFVDNAGTDANGVQTGPMKGGLVLFASGNSGWDHDAPSEYERVVAVGAFGPDGKMPFYSNYGPWVDILAPGGSDSDTASDEWILSCVPDNMPGYEPYAFMPGTSMACPHAAGVAALIVSYFGGPGFTTVDLMERLLSGAQTGVIDQQGRTSGGGKLDAAGSFEYTPEPVDPEHPDIRITTDYSGDYRFKSHEQLTLTWRIIGNERTRFAVSVETDCPGINSTCNVSMAQLYLDALQAAPGRYSATIHVGDAAKKQFSFTILENHAPQLTARIGDQILNAASSSLLTLDLQDYFTDPDGEQLSYSVSLAREGIASTRLSGNTLSFAPEGYGLTEVTVTALDARKASCTASFRLLARNAYQVMDIYPNPVSDFLYIRPGQATHVSATLFSRSGAQVLSANGQADPFQPLSLDVHELAAGTYTLRVEYGGQPQTLNIVKQ